MAFLGAAHYETGATFSYRPRIRDEHMQKLWALKRLRKQPITQLIAEALEMYLDAGEKGGEKK